MFTLLCAGVCLTRPSDGANEALVDVVVKLTEREIYTIYTILRRVLYLSDYNPSAL